MTADQCYGFVCFVAIDSSGQKFFGFAEFLAGLALMVLAWTIADVRYRFRVRTAPIPLHGATFAVVSVVGVLTLLTDLWRAEQWLVPKGNLLTPASWQALLGASFFLTFLTWTWFAFIRPPTYTRHNAERFAQTLYRFVLKGSPDELAVIADELIISVRSFVRNASDKGTRIRYKAQADERTTKPPKVEAYANDLLLLIADKRLCRVIVESSPGTALAMFQEIGSTKKYDIQVGTFAKNIVSEAIANKDSFLFHEAEGYDSGLIGYHKPLSHAMFSNHQMVEVIGTMLDPEYPSRSKWDATQWEAYCRAVLMTFRSYVQDGCNGHSFVLYRAMGYIQNISSDVYKLNGVSGIAWDNDAFARLRVAVDFISDAVKILDEKGVPNHLQLRLRKKGLNREGVYDDLAGMIFEVVFSASAVASPRSECWWIQHNTVWSDFFRSSNKLDNNAGRVVQFKARRLLYNEIAHMNEFPNFKGARILGLCLNVMGWKPGSDKFDRGTRALQKAVLSWTKRHFAWLYAFNQHVGEACLVDGVTYDAENLRIVKTYPAEGLRSEPHYEYIQLDPAPSSLHRSTTSQSPPAKKRKITSIRSRSKSR